MNAKIQTKGMHCKSCEMLIIDSLEEVDGVKNAGADHEKGIVDVDFDDTKVSLDTIKNMIRKEGYGVE